MIFYFTFDVYTLQCFYSYGLKLIKIKHKHLFIEPSQIQMAIVSQPAPTSRMPYTELSI
jgi:hypothetical protein